MKYTSSAARISLRSSDEYGVKKREAGVELEEGINTKKGYVSRTTKNVIEKVVRRLEEETQLLEKEIQQQNAKKQIMEDYEHEGKLIEDSGKMIKTEEEDLKSFVQVEVEKDAKNESGGLAVAKEADEPDVDTIVVYPEVEVRKQSAKEEQNTEEEMIEEHYEPKRNDVRKIDFEEEDSDEEMEVFGGNQTEETTVEEIADSMTEENYKSEKKFYEQFEWKKLID